MKTIFRAGPCGIALLAFSAALGAQTPSSTDNTLTYPAAYFAEFGSVSVNDMLNRIPGIDLALGGNQVPSVNNANDRGLGAEGQIMVNGKRLAGKANETRAQLDRIAASQVAYIEIIRGTSGALDVRSSGQLVNIVLLEEQSEAALSVEAGMARYRDATVEPLGSLSYSGQAGSLQYLFSASVASAYQMQHSEELSVLANGIYNETRVFDRQREQTNKTLNTNLVYQLTPADRVALNGLVAQSHPPATLLRTITDLKSVPNRQTFEREHLPATTENWEVGGDYEHIFSGGDRFKALFIVNERNIDSVRERFVSAGIGLPETKNLYLQSDSRYAERILRSSHTLALREGQTLELGLEHARTLQDSGLLLGGRGPGVASPRHGGLTPVTVPNAFSAVEEVRSEGFAVHNWQVSPRLSMESSLLYEVSEISQSGDVNKSRDFDFVKPKLDLRFNASPRMQWRMSVEKDVSQLSFADFSANLNSQDEDRDTLEGNPDLIQEESWRYNANLDYRLPDDGGVLSARLFYYDVSNAIGRIDVSPNPQTLVSANGNVGDGEIFGLYMNASVRLGRFGLPQAVLNLGLNLEDAHIYDPLVAKTRTIIPIDRGSFRIAFRHDLTQYNASYGFTYQDGIGGVGGTGGNRVRYDIDTVLFYGIGKVRTELVAFAEKTAFDNLTFRLELNNALDTRTCFERKRYNGYLRNGNLREIERSCSTTGAQVQLKVRTTF